MIGFVLFVGLLGSTWSQSNLVNHPDQHVALHAFFDAIGAKKIAKFPVALCVVARDVFCAQDATCPECALELQALQYTIQLLFKQVLLESSACELVAQSLRVFS
jgi:hypothetical protein